MSRRFVVLVALCALACSMCTSSSPPSNETAHPRDLPGKPSHDHLVKAWQREQQARDRRAAQRAQAREQEARAQGQAEALEQQEAREQQAREEAEVEAARIAEEQRASQAIEEFNRSERRRGNPAAKSTAKWSDQ